MGHQTPYIGCKLSLISKMNIRYEGQLCAVNADDPSLTLSQVRTYGTEDRPAPLVVKAQDNVYEYIVFKADDIKDLVVSDIPKQPAFLGGLTYDPAIMSVSHSRTPSEPATLPFPLYPRFSALPTVGIPPVKGNAFLDSIGGMWRAPEEEMRQMGAGVSHSHVDQQKARRGSTDRPIFFPPIPAPRVPRAMNPGSGGVGGNVFQRRLSYEEPSSRVVQRSDKNRETAGGGVTYAAKLKANIDFDFEKANKQFAETINEIVEDMKDTRIESVDDKENEGGDGLATKADSDAKGNQKSEETIYYNRSSSFFDRISYDGRDRNMRSPAGSDWRQMQRTNQDTFGRAAVRTFNAFRRQRSSFGPGGDRIGASRNYNGNGIYEEQERGDGPSSQSPSTSGRVYRCFAP